MAKKKPTVFQALDRAITGNWKSPTDAIAPHVNSYDLSEPKGKVLYTTDNKEDYLQKKL